MSPLYTDIFRNNVSAYFIFLSKKLKHSRTLRNCKHFRNNKSIMFDHIFQFLTLHISKPTQVTLLGDLWFLQVFLLAKKNGTFLANGLHKNIFNKRATKKNNIFGQRATKPYNLSQQATTKYNFSQRAKIIT